MSVRRIERLDEQAIRALLRHLEEAWNRGDGLTYAALFTEDCDHVAIDGSHIEGRAANAKHHQRLLDSVLYKSRLRISKVAVRFITPDSAVVRANAALLMPWQSADAQGRRSLQSYVVVRHDDGWRIAASGCAGLQSSARWGLALRLLRVFVRLRAALTASRLEPAGGW